MVSSEDAITIYRLLASAGISVWLTGGWGIDALLCEETRPHKDLDVLLLLEDVPHMCELMGRQGYSLVELWSENRWVVDAGGAATATAFVLQDPAGRQLDVHAICLDDLGRGIPAWEDEGLVFDAQDLAGEGEINSVVVRCLAPEIQVRLHTGYPLPVEQVRDLELLGARFGI